MGSEKESNNSELLLQPFSDITFESVNSKEELKDNIPITQEESEKELPGKNFSDLKESNVFAPKRELDSKYLSNIEFIANRIKNGQAKKIIVMTGAGISTSAGIPDFRSPGTGLYDNLQKFDLPYAEAIFDIDYFKKRPEPFFELSSELYPGVKYRPTWSHHMIRLFELKGLLLRNFTQNIDGLEHEAGISLDLLVEAHGHFLTSTCLTCRYQTATSLFKPLILEKKVPKCTRCKKGIMKPDITFFGENLPTRFYIQKEKDFNECDLLLVMGTSLKVAPFSTLVNFVKPEVSTVLFNLYNSFDSAPVSYDSKTFDRRLVLAPCDEACWELACLLGWEEELMDMYLSCVPETSDTPKTTTVEEHDLIQGLSQLSLFNEPNDT